MVLPGHLAGGYIATTVVLSLLPASVQFSTDQLTILYIVGILSGEIPDIDLLLFYFLKKKNKDQSKNNHREFITHIPLFWFIISLIIFSLGFLFNSKFIEILALLLLAGTFSHFVFDSIEYGIRWIEPFSKKRLSLFKDSPKTDTDNVDDTKIIIGSIPYYWNYIKTSYIKSSTIYFEITVVIIAIIIIFNTTCL